MQAVLGLGMLWQARLVLARFRKVRSGAVWQVRRVEIRQFGLRRVPVRLWYGRKG